MDIGTDDIIRTSSVLSVALHCQKREMSFRVQALHTRLL